VVVDGWRGGLNEKDLFAAHRLEKPHRHLAVGEPVNGARTDRHVQLACNRCG
jgi:hypothetical protein